ncbi:TPA: hypothetical protein IAA92_06065 [Candidatus Galligastranaerophilus intestinigallinarum]|nr:hypothetical protein [Candidatus Galligastranaerophilus intestinigallinarum]
MDIDLLTKFNRGLCLSLIDTNVIEAIRMYREYSSYLHNNDGEEACKKELLAVRAAFLKKLIDFVELEENKTKTGDLIACYQELIVAFPKNEDLYVKCAKCFKKLEQYDIEVELLEKAFKIKPFGLENLKTLYDAYRNNEQLEKAKETAEKIIEKEPDNSDNYYRLGEISDKIYNKYEKEEDIKNAILNLEIAKKMNPNKKLYYKALTILYTKTGDFQKVKEAWDNCFKFKSQITNTDFVDYGMFLIRTGDFKNGFEFYEKRFITETKAVQYPKINKPLYDGKKDISGKTLLVQSEQGFGDVFLFSRFFYELKNRNIKIIARVPNTTLEIVKRSFPFVQAVSNEKKLEDINFDYHIPLMSLPLALNLNKANIPNKGKYLFADENKTKEFKNKLFNNNKFKIGINYKGSLRGLNTRNVPLEELLPLTKINNVQVYSLQFDEPDETFKDTNIINLAPYIKTFDDTASLTDNMDLMITADNSTMNLSGALGKKTFCLFNMIPEFRWFDLKGNDVKWYSFVKPYQCKKQSEWKPVIDKMVEDIKNMI